MGKQAPQQQTDAAPVGMKQGSGLRMAAVQKAKHERRVSFALGTKATAGTHLALKAARAALIEEVSTASMVPESMAPLLIQTEIQILSPEPAPPPPADPDSESEDEGDQPCFRTRPMDAMRL